MEKIKIYKDSYGDKFVKVKVEFIMDVPIDEDAIEINKDDVNNTIMQIDSSDLADEIFQNMDNFHIITNIDNVKHIEKKYESHDEIFKPIEIEYLPVELLTKIVKLEIDKGNEFAEICVSYNQRFSSDDLEKIKKIGFEVNFDNNKYWITWS
jgi:hypothetical protein